MKYWYHISRVPIKDALLIPRVPETSVEYIEGNIPRICVTPDIWRCIKSLHKGDKITAWDICFLFSTDKFNMQQVEVSNPYVYATYITPYLPPNIPSFRKNDEHWFVTPTQFEFIGRLSIKDFIEQQKEICLDENSPENVYVQDVDFFIPFRYRGLQ